MSGPGGGGPEVRVEPDPGAWAPLAAPRAHGRAPVVMSGHQAELWHPGILAKWFACSACARAIGGSAVWLVVDQDDGEPTRLRYPALDADDRPTPAQVGLSADSTDAPEVPTGVRPAAAIDAAKAASTRAASPGVEAGLRRAADALARHADAPSLARQADAAVRELIGDDDPPAALFATDLAATPAFAELLDAIRTDPALCRRTYNEACAARPDAGIRPLRAEGERVELPLWRLAPGEPRRPVFDDELRDLDPRTLAPRALLMTGLVRRRLCDLFIHGTGGGRTGSGEGYDRVTEAWFESWLGERTLAPAVLATATLRLAIDAHGAPTEADAAEARARAHRARHDPSIIGDDATARAKRSILARVREAKEAGHDPAPHFAEMQTLLDRYRTERAGDLRRLDDEAERLARRASAPALGDDRTWPFVLHDQEAIAALRTQIERLFPRPPRIG